MEDEENYDNIDENEEDDTEENTDSDSKYITTASYDTDNLLNNLKTNHKGKKSNMYFDEEYFQDLVFNKYLPSVIKDENGNIIKRDEKVEKEILANILLVVNAIINKYGIWRFGPRDILQNEGVSECWRSIDKFDPVKGKSFFHYFSLIAKFHLINLTKKDKDFREAADVDICPDLSSEESTDNNFFYEDLENTLFDIIDENFKKKEKHDKYTNLASILMEYIRQNGMIVGKNDLYSAFREYGYKTNDFKKFIVDISQYKDRLFDLAKS